MFSPCKHHNFIQGTCWRVKFLSACLSHCRCWSMQIHPSFCPPETSSSIPNAACNPGLVDVVRRVRCRPRVPPGSWRPPLTGGTRLSCFTHWLAAYPNQGFGFARARYWRTGLYALSDQNASFCVHCILVHCDLTRLSDKSPLLMALGG